MELQPPPPPGVAGQIAFTRAVTGGREMAYLSEALASGRLAGGASFTRRCEAHLAGALRAPRVLLTHSCTGALEMAALLADLQPGDEVIMPSFTFSSTANAFVLRGAVPVFVDIRPDTLNLDERQVEAAIGPRTRAIVPVHYAGLPCDMDALLRIAARHGLLVIEDAAQGHEVAYRGRALGTLGHLGCLSFHETKNLVAGEGGALVINDERFVERAEILREKGTDRSRFVRGQVDKYTWQDVGSSFVPSELSAAVLLAQLEAAGDITRHRRALFDRYREALRPLADAGRVVLPGYPAEAANGHIFWMLLRDAAERAEMMDHLKALGVQSVFHYVPLHSSPAGRRFTRAHGALPVTDEVAARLLRLPMHAGLRTDDVDAVVRAVRLFYARVHAVAA